MSDLVVGKKLFFTSSVSPLMKRELEALVVNNVKIKMLKMLEGFLEKDGQNNLREVCPVPVFEVEEIIKRVEATAPELRTIFYKELMTVLSEVEGKWK